MRQRAKTEIRKQVRATIVRTTVLLGFCTLLPASALAQLATDTAKPAVPTADVQVASAVAALPEEFRSSATVLGYAPDGRGLIELRAGAGPYVCLASQPGAERFHVACYHRSLEPFMARGRELRAQGVAGEQVDTVRYAEIEAGTLAMPTQPAALYSLTGAPASLNAETGEVAGANALYVVYIPYATPESTGITAKPGPNQPWIMYPGTPKAHIMFVPRM